eukprot:scaffold502_cov350-Pavlova_lutheri.AAC.6
MPRRGAPTDRDSFPFLSTRELVLRGPRFFRLGESRESLIVGSGFRFLHRTEFGRSIRVPFTGETGMITMGLGFYPRPRPYWRGFRNKSRWGTNPWLQSGRKQHTCRLTRGH